MDVPNKFNTWKSLLTFNLTKNVKVCFTPYTLIKTITLLLFDQSWSRVVLSGTVARKEIHFFYKIYAV